MKGQLSLEHMILIGVLVFASLILLYVGVQQIGTTHKLSKAEDAVNHLAEKVNELAVLTPGTRDTVWVDLPSGSFELRFFEKSISLVTWENNEEHFIFTKHTGADVLGIVNLTGGLQQILVSKVNDTAVKIGNGPFILDILPQCMAVTELPTQPVVTLIGIDFQPSSQTYAGGSRVFSAVVVNAANITIPSLALPIGPTPSQIAVQTPPDLQSNSVCFHIYPAGLGCGCP